MRCRASVEISHCTVGVGKPDADASKVALWPTSTVVLAGCPVTLGALWTVSVAAWLVAWPATLLNTARYSSPFSESFTFAIVIWSVVASATGLQVLPPSVEISHCTVGVGNPDAVASKVALWPSSTVALTGCLVTTGALWTVSVAASLVALPWTLLNTARNSSPFSEVCALAIVSLSSVARGILVHSAPPSVEISHCTVGAGNPDAAASKLALWPSETVLLTGCLVTLGALWTVSVAGLLTAFGGLLLVNAARNSYPFSESFALAIVSRSVVAPGISVQWTPASVEISHWTVGSGSPVAVDSKVALWPSSTVMLIGSLLTWGDFVAAGLAAGLAPPAWRAQAGLLRTATASSAIARSAGSSRRALRRSHITPRPRAAPLSAMLADRARLVVLAILSPPLEGVRLTWTQLCSPDA